MLDTQYVLGTPADRDDIIDFANYVFSQAHVPHDFKKLLPKTYADGVEGIEQWHFLAKQNGTDIEYVLPDSTLLIENPGAVTEDADAEAQDFADFLLSLFARRGAHEGAHVADDRRFQGEEL